MLELCVYKSVWGVNYLICWRRSRAGRRRSNSRGGGRRRQKRRRNKIFITLLCELLRPKIQWIIKKNLKFKTSPTNVNLLNSKLAKSLVYKRLCLYAKFCCWFSFLQHLSFQQTKHTFLGACCKPYTHRSASTYHFATL